MTTAAVLAARNTPPGVSRIARRMFDDLMAVEPEMRRDFMAGLSQRDLEQVLKVAGKVGGTQFVLWQDDPVGFVEDVLGESTWSKQRQVLGAIPHHKRVAVPSAFGTGKTHIAARAVSWRASCWPVGTSVTVTTATRFRQVRRQLWPHIRTLHRKAGLPGECGITQWTMPTVNGNDFDVAYGFSAPPHDESAVQGIHAPILFIVVDEAGGIGRVIGSAMRGLLTGDDTRMLLIGNPPTDDEGSWFEGTCNEPGVEVIRISAYDSPHPSVAALKPAEEREQVGPCKACPPETPPHSLAIHIVDKDWIDGTIAERGEDDPYVIAKVHARFPRGGPRRVIPAQWVDLALDAPEPDPEDEAYVPLSALGLSGEREDWLVKLGAWVRLGVDVAADGGDEFAISRQIGDLVTMRHTSSGAANTNATDVAGVVLQEIKAAEAVAHALASPVRVRVKVDIIGLGWGVVGTLQSWGVEGLHNAEIVPVDVREDPHREPPPGSTFNPNRKRDELWLSGRDNMQPRGIDGFGQPEPGAIRLRVDKRTAAQLSAPMSGTASTGKTQVESKSSMRQRGVPSPDRAEALLLAGYEPINKPKRKQARLVV